MSQQINLFNPIFLKQKKHFSAVAMLQALGLILLGAVIVTVYARMQLNALEREASTTASRLTATQAQLTKITAEYAPRRKSSALEQDIATAESEFDVEQQILKVARAGNFGKDKGYSDYFRALARQIVPGLWLTGFDISGAGGSIELSGRAMQPELVPEYINRLKHEQVMAGKSFAALQIDVPMVDMQEKGKNESTVKQVPARYVEFRLQSTEGGDDAGKKLAPTEPLGDGPSLHGMVRK